jgi:hypothetical protein
MSVLRQGDYNPYRKRFKQVLEQSETRMAGKAYENLRQLSQLRFKFNTPQI